MTLLTRTYTIQYASPDQHEELARELQLPAGSVQR